MRIRYATGFDDNGNWYCVPEGSQKLPKGPIGPEFITDEMPATQHPCNQQFYTSKAKFREVTRAHGKIEVGNEYDAFMGMKPTHQAPPVRENIKNAFEFLSTIQGKSESERQEIERKFYTDGTFDED